LRRPATLNSGDRAAPDSATDDDQQQKLKTASPKAGRRHAARIQHLEKCESEKRHAAAVPGCPRRRAHGLETSAMSRAPDACQGAPRFERRWVCYARGGGGSGGTVRAIEVGASGARNSPGAKLLTTDVVRSTSPVPPASATSIASAGAQALRILHSFLPPPAVL